MIIKILLASVFFTFVLSSGSVYVNCQAFDEIELSKIKTLLDNSEELRVQKDKGYRTEFSGKLKTIPGELRSELDQNFPEYKFYIAQINVLIDIPEMKYDLILITDKTTSQMKGFVWGNYWTIPPSKYLQKVFDAHRAKSKEDAIKQAQSLAKLIVFTNNDKIGETKFKNRKIKVEMIRGEGVQGVLNVSIDKNFRFQKLTISGPNGRSLRYFV